MRIAHIADTHIKNLKYHFEYREVFKQLYNSLKEKEIDAIIHCGDIAHTKTQISPEFVDLTSDFFRNLSNIAPTYIILGNHDGNLRNTHRQDAITPIVEALDLKDIHLLKNSGETLLKGSGDQQCKINVFSIFDRDNWSPPTDENVVNIALFHGAVAGSQTDVGWTLNKGDINVNVFEGHDYVMLGDIHKTNQILDTDGRVRYAGSTIQQNFGETPDKGYLLWDIKNKNEFTCKHVQLYNPKPFITIELTKKGRIPKGTKVSVGSRIRLVSNNNLPLDKLRKAVDVAKSRFKPESITFLNRAAGERADLNENIEDFGQEDLRDIQVQENLIEEYLKDYEVEDTVLEKVFELNRKYNTIAEEEEEVARNVNWSLKRLSWDNLFNYGEGNSIDFDGLEGIVGIFGKNFSGKSSTIDSLLFSIYNSTSKNERKNLNVINQTKDSARGKVEIEIANDVYTIERDLEKYIKKLKGNETLEAKTNVEFTRYDPLMDTTESLNGLSRTDTDKKIRRVFGTIDDFLLTSMSSQLGSLQFINEGSTKRKEILAKFLDLKMFDEKFKLAKEDASDLRGALKRLEGREFDEEMVEAQQEIDENEQTTADKKEECEEIKKSVELVQEELKELEEAISSIPAEIIDIDQVQEEHGNKKEELKVCQAENKDLIKTLKSKKELYEKISSFESEFDIEEYKEKNELIEEKLKAIENIENEIRHHEQELEYEEKKAELLKEVPCGSEFSHCKFIRDAYAALDKIGITKEHISDFASKKDETEGEVEKLNPEQVLEYIDKYNQIAEKKAAVSNEISDHKLSIEKNKRKIINLKSDIQDLKNKIQEYEENKEAIENLEGLLFKKNTGLKRIEGHEEKLAQCEEEILELYKLHGSLEQRLASIEEHKQELHDLREEFSAYDLLMRCMHSSGIAYDIIKKRLPVINNEIAKVLANIVDFQVYFENKENKLNIYIKHPKYDPRPLAMGSGSEKSMASMAIRLALLTVSSLPKGDIFILDEPGTDLDEENMEGFVRIVELIKSYFKTVILISHLDSLKDCVDQQITIENKNGFAFVNQ